MTSAHQNEFLNASLNGHLAVVERLLEDSRVDPSADRNRAIRMASQNGHLPVVERLLEDSRVDPSAQDNWAIKLASQNGHSAVVERLKLWYRDQQIGQLTNLAIGMKSVNMPVLQQTTIYEYLCLENIPEEYRLSSVTIWEVLKAVHTCDF